ncbi:MAG: hypothetical protein ACP5SD_01345 [Elusimicrobiales bacterium]|nr:hypothetical protein [Elusimicrobiales bacterium]
MGVFKISFFLFLSILFFGFSGYSQLSNIAYENLFESRDYISVLKLSSVYASHKLKIEKAIESNKIESIKKSDLIEIEKIIPKTVEKLDSIYSSVNKSEIKSQIYQIKFELDQTSSAIKEAKNKINQKSEFKKTIYKLEYYIYRIEVYLKGLSQNLSVL